MTTTAVSVKLSDAERARLAKVAKATRRSSHFHLREALSLYLADMESRLDLLRDAEEGMRHYRETGLYYTGDQILEWAESGCGELPTPKSK